MRSFSGLYFFLRIVPYLISSIVPQLKGDSLIQCFILGTIFFVTALIISCVKPYKQAYMNHLDTFLLAYLAFLCYLTLVWPYPLQIAWILLTVPIILITAVVVIYKIMRCFPKCMCLSTLKQGCIKFSCERDLFLIKRSTLDTNTATQPLIQPTPTVVKYGISDLKWLCVVDHSWLCINCELAS